MSILQTRDSLASMIPMVFSMVSQLTSDDTLLDEVQDKLSRILEIVKEKSADAKPAVISTEVDKERRERRRKEKEGKKDKDKKDVKLGRSEPTTEVIAKSAKPKRNNKRATT